MSDQPPHVVTVGEVLLELTRGSDGRFALAYGGDTFNTAVYLARAGLEVAFASALGDDPYSDGVLALAAAEGISRDLILRAPGRLPGLSLIDTEPASTASFSSLARQARRRATCSSCRTGTGWPRACSRPS